MKFKINLHEMAFTLNDNILNEMSRVGFINECEVWIRTDDPGKIPHFHIWDYSTKGKKFHCCVRIDKAEYFMHTGKEDKLNAKDKKDLIKFLKVFNEKRNKTNWQKLLELWNDNNSDIIIDEDLEMPDYTLL